MKISKMTDAQFQAKRKELENAWGAVDKNKFDRIYREVIQEFTNRLSEVLACTPLEAPAVIVAATLYINGLKELAPGAGKAAKGIMEEVSYSSVAIDTAELKKQMEEQ